MRNSLLILESTSLRHDPFRTCVSSSSSYNVDEAKCVLRAATIPGNNIQPTAIDSSTIFKSSNAAGFRDLKCSPIIPKYQTHQCRVEGLGPTGWRKVNHRWSEGGKTQLQHSTLVNMRIYTEQLRQAPSTDATWNPSTSCLVHAFMYQYPYPECGEVQNSFTSQTVEWKGTLMSYFGCAQTLQLINYQTIINPSV